MSNSPKSACLFTAAKGFSISRTNAQQFHKTDSIPLVAKDALSSVAPCPNVVERILKLYPQRPRHAPCLANQLIGDCRLDTRLGVDSRRPQWTLLEWQNSNRITLEKQNLKRRYRHCTTICSNFSNTLACPVFEHCFRVVGLAL